MATIDIHNLNPVGSELFSDSETYLKELSNDEVKIQGGYVPPETEPWITYPNPTRPYSPFCPTPITNI